MAKRKLTLDIGASTVKLAEYVLADGSAQLVNFALQTLPGPADSVEDAVLITSVLEEMSRERGIKPGPITVSLSGQTAFTKFATIPSSESQERFDQLVRYEIEQNVPFPIDEMVCDCRVMGENDAGEKNVMIVAVKADLAEAVCAAVNAAGFTAMSVDVSSLALTNALTATQDTEGCIVILDIGAKTSSLVIAEGDKLYDRSIPVAGNTITREIAAAFGCTFEEAEAMKCEQAYVSPGGVVEDEDENIDKMAKICRNVLTRVTAEISRSINFYRSQQGGGVPVKFYLTGGTAQLPQIDAFFAESLQIEVEFFNPFDIVSLGAGIDEDLATAAALQLGPVTGLAVQSLTGLDTINLLPPSLVSERAETARVPVVVISAVFAIGAFILSLLCVQHGKEIADVTLSTVLRRASVIKTADMKVKSAQEEFEKTKTRADNLALLLGRRVNTVSDMAAVRGALSEGMWIEKWTSAPVAGNPSRRTVRVTVRGWADDIKAIVEKSKSSGAGGKSTASEIVLERLKAARDVDPSSVKIAEMTTIGDVLSQFVVTLEFGRNAEGESK